VSFDRINVNVRRHIAANSVQENLKVKNRVLGVRQICALLGYYAASSGNPLPTFRDNVSVPSLSAKKSKKNFSS
jgi:hypothetical protein